MPCPQLRGLAKLDEEGLLTITEEQASSFGLTHRQIEKLIADGQVKRHGELIAVGTWHTVVVRRPFPTVQAQPEPSLERYSSAQRKVVQKALEKLKDASSRYDESCVWANYDPKIVVEALTIWLKKLETDSLLKPAYARAILVSLARKQAPKRKANPHGISEKEKERLNQILDKWHGDNKHLSFDQLQEGAKRITDDFKAKCSRGLHQS